MPSIYEAFPYLERDWDGISHSKSARFSDTEEWYFSRLNHLSGPICELGCGYGRLLVKLARSGIEVHGTDVAKPRVEAAKEYFSNLGIRNAHFHHCEMPRVPKGVLYDAVLLTTNAIGYIRAGTDKNRLLMNISAILKDDGLLLMDHSRGSLALQLLRHWPGLRGQVCNRRASIRSSLDWKSGDHAICESFVLQNDHNDKRVYSDLFKFDRAGQTLSRLRSAGFSIEQTYGSYKGHPLRPWSRMIALVARKDGHSA